jgi:hypothetical protein
MTASVDAASAAPLERAGAEPFLELSSGAVLLFVNPPRPRCSPAGRTRSRRPAC